MTDIETLHKYGLDDKTKSIYIMGDIDNETTSTAIKNINAIAPKRNNKITIHMQSPGGDADLMWGLYDLIKQKNATIYGYGIIASAAAYIFQAGRKRIMTRNSVMMIHAGVISVDGTHKVAKSAIDQNEKDLEKYLDVFVERYARSMSNVSPLSFRRGEAAMEIDQILKGIEDWYLSAEEAAGYGFCDEVI